MRNLKKEDPETLKGISDSFVGIEIRRFWNSSSPSANISHAVRHRRIHSSRVGLFHALFFVAVLASGSKGWAPLEQHPRQRQQDGGDETEEA